MADKRINALATTASSTASDDFFAVDGTTNGTRKLNAFSPTFGGNATVTGTLTVNGSGTTNIGGMVRAQTATYSDSSPAGLSQAFQVDTAAASTRDLFSFGDSARHGLIRGYQDGAGVVNFRFGRYAASTFSEYVRIAGDTATNAVFTVYGTTASTTTSTGALVVSGGVGVAKAIVVGEGVTATGTVYSAAALSTAGGLICQNADITGGYITLRGFGNQDSGLIFLGQSTNNNYISSNATTIGVTIANTGITQTVAAGLRVLTSTASTSTSSGALVVSGGVGVGGNLSIGGDVLIDKSAIEVLLKRSANTNDGLIKFQTGIFGDFGIGHRGTSDSDLHIYNYGTAADALKIAKNDSLATFAAAIRTAAPSGGTAANWKLGTVATVSPTSPNRTIEVDIGGTIYYIHAKTTNN